MAGLVLTKHVLMERCFPEKGNAWTREPVEQAAPKSQTKSGELEKKIVFEEETFMCQNDYCVKKRMLVLQVWVEE